MEKKEKSLEEQLYLLGLVVLIVGGISIFLYLEILLPNVMPIPCIFKKVFGIYCPGCGGTRAVNALLHGHILLSLWYHPLVIYTIIVFGDFMLTNTMAKIPGLSIKGWKFHEWHLYGALIIVVINFILKNVLLLCFNIKL